MVFTKTIMIGRSNDKSGISLHYKHNNAIIKDPDQISNILCYFCIPVGPSHATPISESVKQLTSSELP